MLQPPSHLTGPGTLTKNCLTSDSSQRPAQLGRGDRTALKVSDVSRDSRVSKIWQKDNRVPMAVLGDLDHGTEFTQAILAACTENPTSFE